MLLGIDEVGRGPWAGPLLVGAVILPKSPVIEGLTDSKKLSAKKRQKLSQEIKATALAYSLGWVSAEEIDNYGLGQALKTACIRAVEQINLPYEHIVIDGNINFLKDSRYDKGVSVIKKADLLVPAVSAAAIVAKVARDNYMSQLALRHPEYHFSTNMGYGTKAHRQAIGRHGVTPFHRLSFKPLAPYRQPSVKDPLNIPPASTSKQKGDQAETVVANYLKAAGHKVLRRNYKTKWSEIDIISLKGDVIYFTEVKYRSSTGQGGALEAVDYKKQEQMALAAKAFMATKVRTSKNQFGLTPRLAVGLVGPNYQLLEWFQVSL